MITNSGLTFIKNNPYLSATGAVIILYLISWIPGEVWLILFFIAALAGEMR
jgi:hypothetical protein